MTKTIALCGKGGVGKTSLSALITKIISSEKKNARILTIDADPAVGLATALGINPSKTINDIRNDVIKQAQEGTKEEKIEIINLLDYAVLDAMIETNGFAFIAIGRPESDGCYCKINSYLREIISNLSQNFDYVIIDGEAGIEQVNRRVMEEVSHLMLISDCSRKGLNVIETISEVANDLVKPDKTVAIVNRVKNKNILDTLSLNAFDTVCGVQEDEELNYFDIQGTPLLELPETPAIKDVKEILRNMDII